MAATGDILVDLPELRRLCDSRRAAGGDNVAAFFDEFGPPATDEEIAAAVRRLPELPDDVQQIVSVATHVDAGWLRIGMMLDIYYLEAQNEFLHLLTSEHHEGRPVPDPHMMPQGKLLNIGSEAPNSCVVELEGDHPGRVWTFWVWHERFWHPVAWSLADLIACMVDLIEIGWYQWRSVGPFGPETIKTNEQALAFTADILERWACNPLILQLPGGEATFVDPPPKTT